MAAGSPADRGSFSADLSAALETATAATTVKTRLAKNSHFAKWVLFCHDHGHDSTLALVDGDEAKLTYLLVFGLRYRRRPGRAGKPVRADTVGKALQAIGQGMADLGVRDPRKARDGGGKLHPLLAAFLDGLKRDDDPSTRAYPANLTIIEAIDGALDFADAEWGGFNAHVRDLTILGFFWLLRPSEYTHGDTPDARSQAFRLRDIELTISGRHYHGPEAPLNDANTVRRVTHAHLTFADQKNAVRGERISHSANSDPVLCPVKALGRIVHHLRTAGATPDTPLCLYRKANGWEPVRPRHITNALRHAGRTLEASTGILANRLSCRSLRPGGATALMIAGIDSDHIGLLGRWKSDAMFRYLRIQASTYRAQFAQRMLDHGRYTFAPGVYDRPDAAPVQTPPAIRALLDHPEAYDD